MLNPTIPIKREASHLVSIREGKAIRSNVKS